MGRMRPLYAVLGVQLVIGLVLVVLVVSGALPLSSDGNDAKPGVGAARTDRFNENAAWRLLKYQVRLGPRPAGSAASRKLAKRLKKLLPRGRFQKVPGGLRNVVGRVPGKGRGFVVVGAHYDTKDLPGFVGANDGAGGTAAVVTIARQLKPRTIGPDVVFILFDGEEVPRGGDESNFYEEGLRGSKVAARKYRKARSMILLDFIADKKLSIPHEGSSNVRLWERLRRAAKRAGVGSYFPDEEAAEVIDDHEPFLKQGVPAINLIDFDFPCWHRKCDDMSAVSRRSLDASGEAVAALLRTLK